MQQTARHLLIDNFSPNFNQPAITHTRRAGGFTGAAGQAAVQMRLCLAADGVSFQHLLDQINTAARPVQFVTQQLVGWAGRGTKTAMHAGSQDTLRILDVMIVFKLTADVGLHSLQPRVKPARVQNIFRIERLFQVFMNAQQSWR